MGMFERKDGRLGEGIVIYLFNRKRTNRFFLKKNYKKK